MLYYYPTQIPVSIDKSKLNTLKNHTYTTTLLYSSEGMFQIRKGKLYSVHFEDDNDSKTVKLGDVNYIVDKSNIKWSSVDKLPYDFIRKDTNVTCYEKDSLKFYIEETENKISHMYFFVKDPNFYGINNDIIEFMRKILKASF